MEKISKIEGYQLPQEDLLEGLELFNLVDLKDLRQKIYRYHRQRIYLKKLLTEILSYNLRLNFG